MLRRRFCHMVSVRKGVSGAIVMQTCTAPGGRETTPTAAVVAGGARCGARLGEGVEERGERDGAVVGAGLALEAAAVVADVDVGELLDEAHEVGHDAVEAVCVHLAPHARHQRPRRRLQPPVEHVARRRRRERGGWVEGAALGARARHVLREEAVRVVPRQEHRLDHLEHAALLEAQRLGAHDGRVDEVEAQRIGAVLGHHLRAA